MQSYDCTKREGVEEILWGDFGEMAAKLAERVARFKPQVIVGIARAGLFPATALACMLRCEIFPARMTRRVNDRIVHKSPVWKVPISTQVAGHVVAVVDDITDSGETLSLAAQAARDRGAKHVITASLVSHSWANPAPDITALVSDALVIFPWDRQVFVDRKWRPHPEIVAALHAQAKSG